MDRPVTDLSAVRRPIASANGLPNAHYTDNAVFEEEKHALLFDGWSGIAVASDVPEQGDALPVDFLGVPLLVLRDRQGKVRVFQNICRHRGMVLVNSPRKIEGAIRCPYHSWCYSTEGRLVSTPHVGGPGQNIHPDIDKATMGLIEVPSHICFDVVFVNVSGTAPAFEEMHADLLERWKEFNVPLYHGGADSKIRFDLRTNWKLVVENYCESYHLPWVHPGLNSYSRLEDHYHIEERGKFSGQGTHVYRQISDEDGAVFADFPGLSKKWESAGEYLTFLPNVMVGVQRDHVFVILLDPVAVDRTVAEDYYAAMEIIEKRQLRTGPAWDLDSDKQEVGNPP